MDGAFVSLHFQNNHDNAEMNDEEHTLTFSEPLL
jgi:hypothetical protein